MDKLPQYSRLIRRGVYPGIDTVYYGSQGTLEYDFVLAPGADPSQIRIRVEGGSGLKLDASGALVVETAQGEIRQQRPLLYQTAADGTRVKVDGAFRLTGRNEAGFTVANYDRRRTLAIDPVLESSTYLGGNFDDRIVGAANGTVIAGMTTSLDFPGAAFGRRKGNDVFAYSAANGTLWIIGGSGDEQVTAVTFDYYNGIQIAGYTDSKDLPTIQDRYRNPYGGGYYNPPDPWQADFAGGATDGFYIQLSGRGGSYDIPLFVTYVGTPGDDRITALGNYYGSSPYAMVGTTTGTGLPGTYSTMVQQSGPRGGIDGFLLTYYASDTPQVYYLTYFGGTGDDRPMAVTAGYDGYYVAGETSSDDFPLVKPMSSKRSGTSDAFVAQFAVTTGGLGITSSTLFGGSGADKVTAMTMFNQDVIVAGTTGSKDLPLKNPLQAAYGGGASDIFLTRFTTDLSAIVSSTYYGGTGAEEPAAIDVDGLNNMYIAGWTSSPNFPVKNAIQAKFGGGADDGFLMMFDEEGALQQSTYLGGSGSDRIYGVTGLYDFTVWVAGQTTSPNFPLKNASQSTLRGNSDGFVAQISTALIDISNLTGGKNVRTFSNVTLGRLNGSATTPVTVTSTSPGSVLLAGSRTEGSKASVTLAPTSSYQPYYRSLYIDCLVDEGGADITVAAAGYSSRTYHVACGPVILSVGWTGGSNKNRLTASLWGDRQSLTANLRAQNPITKSSVSAMERPGIPLTLQVSNSNPSVLTIDVPNAKFNDQYASVYVQPLAIGTSILGLSVSGLGISQTATIDVVSPLYADGGVWVPKGYQTYLSISTSGYSSRAPQITVTSGDPSKLVLSSSASQAGSKQVTIPAGSYSGQVYAQALASNGDVSLTITMEGFAPETRVIHLADPVVGCYGCSTPVTVGVGTKTYVSFQIRPSAGINRGNYQANPNTPSLRFSLDNSNPSAVAVSPASAEVGTSSNEASFTLTGLAAGTAKLAIHGPQGIPLDSKVPNAIQVNVTAKALKMDDIEVGKDLATTMRLILPNVPTTATQATVTINDTSLALLASGNSSQGTNKLTIPFGEGNTIAYFYVQGLKAAGVAKVTATVPGYGPVTANVQLDPSGFGWDSDAYSTAMYSSSTYTARLTAFALDAATLIPVGSQSVRFGVSAAVKVTSSNPGIVTVDASATLPTQSSVALTPKASGTAVLSLTQPQGFTTPAVRQKLNVTINRSTLAVSGAAIARDTQTTLQITGPAVKVNQNVTITSGDPTKLLLSATADKAGSASITIPLTSSSTIYAQALKSSGTVTVTASASGFNSGAGTVTLADLGVGIGVSQGYPDSVNLRDGVAWTTTQSPNSLIQVGLFQVLNGASSQLSYGYTLRPGAALPPVEVKSGNSKVGVIVKGPAVFSNALVTSVEFQPVASGDVNVMVTQPQGFVAPPNAATSVRFRVTQPSLATTYILLGRDTYVSTSVGIPSIVKAPSKNMTVTLTSPDPSRVLLGADAQSTGSASITKTLVAGQRWIESIYVHALGNSGTVPVKVSAPGWADAAINVALGDTVFGISQGWQSVNSVRAVLQNGVQKLTIGQSVASSAQSSGYQTFSNAAIRPGAPSIAISVSTSDAKIVAVDSPQVTFAPGTIAVDFQFRPVKTGQATLSLSVPPAYKTDAKYGKVAVSVEGAKLSLSNYVTLGRDLQTYVNLSAEGNFAQPVTLTITSSDPSSLLVSSSGTAAGKGQITMTTSGPYPKVYVQALNDNGTPTVTVSAPGYQSATAPVTLAPSAVVFYYSGSAVNMKTNSPAQAATVALSTLDPETLRPRGDRAAPRAGLTLSIPVTSSNTKVVTVDKPKLEFKTEDPQSIQITPAGAGTAIVSLGVLPDGVPPASGGQLVFNVTKP